MDRLPLVDQEKSIRPVAIARYDEGYVETVKGTWADSERGNGSNWQALLDQRYRRDANFAIWKGEALKRGYSSSIALPLRI